MANERLPMSQWIYFSLVSQGPIAQLKSGIT